MTGSTLSIVKELMEGFARETGLTGARPPRRYLWTDAFAVCNYLELYHQTVDREYLEMACRLVDQVHQTLGRHRADDERVGWISGLNEEEGRKHPTAGGLRIGKEMNERSEDDPYDSRLEWERDGQYFHYLTKWMHALNRLGQVSNEPVYLRWAGELAETACTCFCYRPDPAGPGGMYWKMSIDLSRPLVRGMGQHDPLDGYLICRELQAAIKACPQEGPDLIMETEKFESMTRSLDLVTDDPLGLGGLLTDAFRLVQLRSVGDHRRPELLMDILRAIPPGLKNFIKGGTLRLSVDYRLAFRELGLAIGLHSPEHMEAMAMAHPELFEEYRYFFPLTRELKTYSSLGRDVEEFWLDDVNLESRSWKAHEDINRVMLATSLAPTAYLSI
ncbi:MAG: hypothetical protein ACLFV2_10355 [Desulfurivibrionaceae bacterium]